LFLFSLLLDYLDMGFYPSPAPCTSASPKTFASVHAGAEEPRRVSPSTFSARKSMEIMPFPQIFCGFCAIFADFLWKTGEKPLQLC
jgi:hypothetical protein